MILAHVTKTGNISIPKAWRDDLGIEPNSSVLIDKTNSRIVIEPLKKDDLKTVFSRVDDEVRRKRVVFSRQEAVRDDLYD